MKLVLLKIIVRSCRHGSVANSSIYSLLKQSLAHPVAARRLRRQRRPPAQLVKLLGQHSLHLLRICANGAILPILLSHCGHCGCTVDRGAGTLVGQFKSATQTTNCTTANIAFFLVLLDNWDTEHHALQRIANALRKRKWKLLAETNVHSLLPGCHANVRRLPLIRPL